MQYLIIFKNILKDIQRKGLINGYTIEDIEEISPYTVYDLLVREFGILEHKKFYPYVDKEMWKELQSYKTM